MLSFEYKDPSDGLIGSTNSTSIVAGISVYFTSTGAWGRTSASSVAVRDNYGSDIPSTYLTRTPYRRIWSDVDPTHWKLGIDATTTKGSSRIVLKRPTMALVVGDEVDFIETLANDASTEVLSGAKILAIDSDHKTITTDTNATETTTGYLTRSSYSSELAGYDDSMITGGNTILRLIGLGESEIVCHDRGFLVMTPTGDSASPFTTTEGYTGPEALWLRWYACAPGSGESLIYRSKNRWMAVSLPNMTPYPVDVLENVRELFLDLTEKDEESCFCSYNAVDREVWFVRPESTAATRHGQVVCLNLDSMTVHTVSTVSDSVKAVWTGFGSVVRANIAKTGAEDWWWLMGSSDGRVSLMHVDRSNNKLSLRYGHPYCAQIEFGFFGQARAESQWIGHSLELSSTSPSKATTDICFYSSPTHSSSDMKQWGHIKFNGTPPHRIRVARRGSLMNEIVLLTPPPGGALPAISRRVIDYYAIDSESCRPGVITKGASNDFTVNPRS